jgi:hypothetical protein
LREAARAAAHAVLSHNVVDKGLGFESFPDFAGAQSAVVCWQHQEESMPPKFWLLLALVLASWSVSASAQQTSGVLSGSTVVSGTSQTQTGAGAGLTSSTTSISQPAIPTFNPVNSAPTRTILTPSGSRQGAGNSTVIVCDFTDFSGAFGSVVDVCSD